MFSIGQLCNKYSLSRSTLLYYDSIGLLKASERTASNYRRYTEEDDKRLNKICMYRETGMPLDEIRILLNSAQDNTDDILEKQLVNLNNEMKELEIKRQIIVQMLSAKKTGKQTPGTIKARFVQVLRNAGLDDEKMMKLHVDFEKISPEEHLAFLRFLGIPENQIEQIRQYSEKSNSSL